MKQLVAISIASSLLGACALSDLEEPGEPEVTIDNVFYKPQCDEWGCGLNSPYLDSRGFYWLYKQAGTTTPDGFTIIQFVDRYAEHYNFEVINSRIYGTKRGAPSITGQQLIGAKLWVAYQGQALYQIKIVAVDRVMSWASQNGVRYPIDTYWFQWSGDNEKFQDMCQGDHLDDEMGMNTHHTIVFEGDQIDSVRKKLIPGINNNVVNFGCAGSALAKLALTGHNEVGAHNGFATTTEQRTTILKMFSADYCGDGTPFTVGGQKLRWADDKDWMNVQPFVQLEARWTPTGPACLNTPRIDKNPTPLSASTFPQGAEAAIANHVITESDGTTHSCQRPPTCPAGSSSYDPGAYHLISSNPVTPIIIPL